MTNQKETRDRTLPLKTYVTASEREAIEEKAQAANMTISQYLRVVGIGGHVKAVADNQAIMDMLKINGDLGRLGGLLKFWLTKPPNVTFSSKDVRNTLKQIEELQQEMREIVSKVYRA